MRLLLDMHILLWAITNDSRLPSNVRELLLDPHNDVFFSAATIWEIAIKRSLRRIEMPVSAEEAVRLFRDSGYEELGISSAHAAHVEGLPMIHADPFDRILVVQALTEPMRLITRDKVVAAYSPGIMLV